MKHFPTFYWDIESSKIWWATGDAATILRSDCLFLGRFGSFIAAFSEHSKGKIQTVRPIRATHY